MLENLNKYNIFLASNSPRRQELLAQLGIAFKVFTIDGIKETYPETLPKERVAEYLSGVKADAYVSLLKDNDLVITADTIVLLDGKVYGKPTDSEDAKKMLVELSGRTHKVISGVTIISKQKRLSISSTTKVKFAHLSPEDIEYYVMNFHPLDKAGAYGIQEWIGVAAVEGIEGSYYNVMGLPVHRLYQELKKL